jgi:hypothetical protein
LAFAITVSPITVNHAFEPGATKLLGQVLRRQRRGDLLLGVRRRQRLITLVAVTLKGRDPANQPSDRVFGRG